MLALALAAAGCNEGNELATGAFDFSQPSDGANMTPADLAASDDLASAGKSCGQIVSCAIQCGTTNATCLGACFTGADPQGLLEAGALVACAAQSCLAGGGDGGIGGGLGGGGTAGIFQCLIMNCQMQIAGCPGLFPAPM